jgi:hypothetical protein
MTNRTVQKPQNVPKKEPAPPGTEGSSKTQTKGKSVETKKEKSDKSAEKAKKKIAKEEKKKKKKSEKSGDWTADFDEDFAKKREELDKILSETIAKPKPKPERKRSESSKGDRLSQVKKRSIDFDSSPYEDISDMSDISSDESYLGERRVEVVRHVDKGRGYRGLSRSPLR